MLFRSMGLEYNGAYYPFEIYSRERDERNMEVLKQYKGNQIWIPINQDILATVKIFPQKLRKFEIEDDCKESIERRIKKELRPKDWDSQSYPKDYDFTLAISRGGSVKIIEWD